MTPAITTPGIYEMPNAEYHACHWALSSTGARKLLDLCPAKFKAELEAPPAATDALEIGSAAHAYLLEGENWPQRHVVLPEDHTGTTKEGKARLAAIIEAGKTPLKTKDWLAIKAMVEAMHAHPFAGKLFVNGLAERSLFWKDEATGIWCRARPDWLVNGGHIVPDYKTTRSAHPDDLRSSLGEYGYYQQAAWYADGLKALGITDRPAFVLAFQEKTPPYLVTVAQPTAAALEWGRIRNRKACEVFANCVATGVWPGYAEDVIPLDLPVWLEKRLERDHAAGLYATTH